MHKATKVVLGIGVLALLLCSGGVVGLVVLFGRIRAELPKIETYEVPGDANAFDPIAAATDLARVAGSGATLVEADFSQVKSDGTMDLDVSYVPAPNARYTFVRPLAKPPENAPPVGAGRGIGGWYEEIDVQCFQPGARRTQVQRGGNVSSRINYIHQGVAVRRDAKSGTMPPELRRMTPSPVAMWKVALAEGAPPDAVATIQYEVDSARFSITGTEFRYRWDANGSRIR